MKTVAIIQARLGSTRLPGKVLKEVNNKPLLAYQLERLRMSNYIDEIVIATTVKSNDDPIVEFCDKNNISHSRGAENDVLKRYYDAALEYNADTIVRVTSDCPIIDPAIVDLVIKEYLNSPELDYVSNTLERTYPRGMDTEVFSFESLKIAHNQVNNPSYREHVTPYIQNTTNSFNVKNVSYVKDESHHRWTVDTPEDLELITNILDCMYPIYEEKFTLQDTLNLVNEKKEWSSINQHIEQKKV